MNEETLISAITEKTGLVKEEIIEKINAKEAEFAGLVSRLGAAYIVGKELGVDLATPVSKELKIKNIVPDMRSVTFVGKILEIAQLREFETSDGKSKVINITLGDETGSIRLAIWDEKAEEAAEKLQVGQVWQIIGGYTRRDSFGNAEVRLGKWGNLKSVDVEIQAAPLQKRAGRRDAAKQNYRPSNLKGVTDEDFVEVVATLLSVNERQALHYFCPVCRAKVEAPATECAIHKGAKPEKLLIVSGVIDDGYGSIGAAFFRQAAESLLGLTTEEVEEKMRTAGSSAFFDSLSVIGGTFSLWGVIRRNKLTGSLELIVHRLKNVAPKEEIAGLLKEVEIKV